MSASRQVTNVKSWRKADLLADVWRFPRTHGRRVGCIDSGPTRTFGANSCAPLTLEAIDVSECESIIGAHPQRRRAWRRWDLTVLLERDQD